MRKSNLWETEGIEGVMILGAYDDPTPFEPKLSFHRIEIKLDQR